MRPDAAAAHSNQKEKKIHPYKNSSQRKRVHSRWLSSSFLHSVHPYEKSSLPTQHIAGGLEIIHPCTFQTS